MNANNRSTRGPSASVFRRENQAIKQLHEKARELAEKQTIEERGRPRDSIDRKRWFARRSDLQKSKYIELLEQGYHGWSQKFHALCYFCQDFNVNLTDMRQFCAELYQRWQATQKLLDEVRASANSWRHKAEQFEKELSKLSEAVSPSEQNEFLNRDASLSSNSTTVPVDRPPPHPAVPPDCGCSFIMSPLTATDVPQPVPQPPHDLSLYSIFDNNDSDADYSENNALGNHTDV